VQPVDLAHLSAQTGGDRVLEAEILRMFAARSLADLARLKAAPPASRRDMAHLIVGSARAIGAGEVARLAAAIEIGEGDIHLLEVAIGQARTFIAEYLDR
jgi:HPt (histidine-containing phosphotransfer) domain-containing protein